MPRVPRSRLITDGLTLRAGWRDLVERVPAPVDVGVVIPTPEIRRFTSAHLYGPELEIEPGDIVVDLIRPEDLLQLGIHIRGARLVTATADEQARVEATADGFIVVRLPFQHAHEQAAYEQSGPAVPEVAPETAKPSAKDPAAAAETLAPPVAFRPARASRLGFRLPAGTTFPFTMAGILAQLSGLEPIVSPRALPASPAVPDLGVVAVDPRRSVLVGDLIATLHPGGVAVSKATAAERRALSPTTPAAAGHAADLLRRIRAEAPAGTVSAAAGVAPDLVRDTIGVVLNPRVPIEILVPRTPTFGAPPAATETAIEAPFRLVISPSALGRWVHAADPVAASDAPGHVELWHSRLGTAREGAAPSEHPDPQRIIRALWTRDRDPLAPSSWQAADADVTGALNTPKPATAGDPPSRGSLTRADRHRLVRQTSERWRLSLRRLSTPEPMRVDKLWLSSLGAWIDVHGRWDTLPYSASGMPSVLSWDHIAPQGRDQFVRVTYPGYLYPTGHKAVLVKITERKIRPADKPVAGLYQRMFIVVTEPSKSYPHEAGLPFREIALDPLVTPDLSDPQNSPDPENQDAFFWPRLSASTPFRFTLQTTDRDGYAAAPTAPLLWVAEHWGVTAEQRKALDDYYLRDEFSAWRTLGLAGAQIAFAPRQPSGDARLATNTILLRGHAAKNTVAPPTMTSATVVVPAAQRLAGTGELRITYDADYRATDLASADPPAVWAATVDPGVRFSPVYDKKHLFTADQPVALPTMAFGPTPQNPGQADAEPPTEVGSDAGGGFVQPNLAIRGLSTADGPVGDVASAKSGQFDAKKALEGVLPRLFGLVSLLDLLPDAAFDELPEIVTETLGEMAQFISDLQGLKAQGEALVSRAQTQLAAVAAGASADYRQRAEDALTTAQGAQAAATQLADDVHQVFATLTSLSGDEIRDFFTNEDIGTRLQDALTRAQAAATGMPPLVRGRVIQIVGALQPYVAQAQRLLDLVDRFVEMAEGIAALAQDMRFRFAWEPPMHSWKPVASDPKPTLDFGADNGHPLTIAIEGRMPAQGEAQVEVLAEVRRFDLNLIPSAQLLQIPFEHISFRASSKGKAEVDVVLGEIRFLGILDFINDLKDLIPFDGFSDPPFLDVSAEGIKAGFSLSLPNLAIGVFSLSNISLGADVRVPFLGNIVTVGFNFCTREKPLVLAVMFLGGGGFFGIRLSPERVELLELSLEAGAYLSVDFGVASGSISAAIGIYIRMEGDDASLTGFLRLRGEVDVLGLISASIELYLELTYKPATGKMLGRAMITVTVEVFIFSGTVKIECERQFAGSNGDPSWRQMYLEEGARTAPPWDQYLDAFASEEVPA